VSRYNEELGYCKCSTHVPVSCESRMVVSMLALRREHSSPNRCPITVALIARSTNLEHMEWDTIMFDKTTIWSKSKMWNIFYWTFLINLNKLFCIQNILVCGLNMKHLTWLQSLSIAMTDDITTDFYCYNFCQMQYCNNISRTKTTSK